jgi:hypothetical protein
MQRRLESCLLFLEKGTDTGTSVEPSVFGSDFDVRLDRYFADLLYGIAMRHLRVQRIKVGDNAKPVEFFVADAAEDTSRFLSDCNDLLVEFFAGFAGATNWKHGALAPEADASFANITQAVSIRQMLRNFKAIPPKKGAANAMLLLHHSIKNADE